MSDHLDVAYLLASVPSFSGATGFDKAARTAGAEIAVMAADDQGLRAVLLEAVKILMVGVAAGADNPTAALQSLGDELMTGSRQLLYLARGAAFDA